MRRYSAATLRRPSSLLPATCYLLPARRGSLLLDALLSVAIFGLVVASFSTGLTGGQTGTVRGGNRVRATYLAEEGLEALRSIRDRSGGFTTISARPLGQDDGVTLTGADWTIVENPTTIDAVFTRKVVFSAGPDSNTRKVTSTVTWTEYTGNQTLSYSAETYLTNWLTPPPPPPPNWSQPILKGSVLYTAHMNLEEATLEDIEVSGNYAFAANSGSAGKGVIIYNIANISSPSYSSAVIVWATYDIAISGNYAYIATSDVANELKILDISGAPTVTCCAAQIDLTGSGPARGVSITGTGLYIVRETSTGPELYVYDIGDSATAPTLLATIESDPVTRNMYAVTATGASVFTVDAQPYAYIATNYTTDELTVASVTGAQLTGAGDAPGGVPQNGKAVAIFNTGAFLGVSGDSACEVLSFDIFQKLPNPNAAPACGSGKSYDLGGSSDASDSANDMGVGRSLSRLFIAAYVTRTGVRHFLHILDVSDVHDISSPSKKIYDGNILQGYETYKGLFYRESDHTLFMVGGAEFGPGSDLTILQPTYTYN